MLFDLQGKRRRVVQATYLGLAVLMGGGLVLFGIGGEVSGGLVDAFSGGGGGGGDGNSVYEKRIEKNEKRLKANPRSEAARKELVRAHHQLATARSAGLQGGFTEEAKGDLRKAAANWTAYLALEPAKPDTSLARVMLQVYDPVALAKPQEAFGVARLIAEREETSEAYLNLVGYAALAGDMRVAGLAGQRAIDLAPKGERKEVKAKVKQQKQAQAQPPAAPAQP